MDGSLNQAAGHGQSARSPATPSSNSYQVNVNRKKTKKWVEAKVQSYDGDDWGAPESEEDEEPDSPQAPPPVPRPAADQRLPSESRLPGAGRPGHLATGSTTSNLSKSSGGQTLSIQTQPTAAPANGVAPSSGAHDNVASPQSDQSQPLTRPTDIYHRMEEGKQKGEQAAEPTVTVAGVDEDPSGAGDAGPKRLSVSPQLPNVARMSGFGVDFFSNGSEPPANRLSSQPTVQEEREPTPEPQVEEETAKERDSVASGPTLPATTFTPPTSAKAEPEPEKSTESHESVPSENVSEDTTAEQSASQVAPPTQAEGGDVSPISKHGDTVKGLAAAVPESDSQKHLQAGQDARSLPPLRTPSPHEPRTVPPPVSDEAPAEPASEITPTEPLQPKKPEHSPSDYEPQPLERQLTIDTVTSSPVKESDVLSDEIMRTLTPGGLSPVDNRKSQVPRAGRESSYTLSGYDDYWADTADKQGDNPKRKSTAPGGLGDVPEHPPVPSAFTEAKSPEPMPVSPNSTTSPPLSGGQASLRRRFSWEAEEEQPPKPAPAVSPPSTITSPLAQNPVQSLPASEQPKQTASPGPTSPTIKVVPDTASVSEQVSQPSSAPAPSSQPSLEPPSPVSEVSDEDATPLGQPQGAQFPVTEDRSVEPSLPSSVSGTQHGEAPAVSPAVSSSAPTGQKIMTFREIMNIPTPANRIEKYSETRNVFASQDSGLENWITTMRNEYPEHARASASFSGVVLAPPPSANAGQAPGHQPSAQQPYYQQYLNATTPSNTGSARSRLAGIPQQAQAAAGSAFGHGGNQIGTKGKEFMQSAGKMGKGLFSKGKSKLRGTGDKDDTSSPSAGRKPQKTDRRTSWTPNLGLKSRTGTMPQAQAHATPPTPPTVNTSNLAGPPRLAEPTRVSPLLTEQSPTTQGVLWQPPTSVGGQPASATTDPAGNKTAGPGDQHHAPQPAGHAQHTQAIDDRVAVPRQNADRDTVASTQNAHTAHRAAPTVAVAVHQDSGVAMASQPDPPPDAQRNSSFKGLPPIRRNSSFGLSSIDVMQEAEQRVSADDEASAAATQNGSHQHEQTHVNQHEATLQPTENATNQSMGVDSNATLVGQDGTNRTGRSSLSKEPMRYYQPPTQPPSQQLQYDLSVPSQLQQGQGQRPAGHPGSGSPQPPSGWRLEESHLSEPLHVARRRAGTENSQQPSAYGLEKETGVPGPMSPESTGYEPGPAPAAPAALAPAGPPAPTLAPGPQPPRGRTSDVPPSSAQRYPELFRPAGQPQQQQQYGYGYANPQDQPMPGYKPYPPRVSYDGKAHESGFEATSAQAEERGRRKSSGIFKGIGDRFARATSRERRTSVSDQGPAQLNMQNGSNYPTEQPQEPKKRRPSFILASLRSRPSMDAVSSHRPDSPAMSQTQESQAPEGSIMSKSEKKKSLLGSKISAAQQKFIPGSISRSSTPSLVNDTASTGTGAGANDNPSMGPPKKRFSGFADKAAGFTSRFRQGHDGHQKPGTSHSAVSSASGLPQDPAGQVSSPAPKAPGRNIGTSDSTSSFKMAPPHPPHSRDRSGSGGSFGMASPPAPGSEQQERRGRRGSFTGMMSNLMGGRSSSKSRQSEEPQQPALQNFYGPQHNAAPSGPVPQPPVHREIPSPTSPPSAHGRTPSWDGSQRASRHLSGGYVQPSRPSPLAQESSATAGESAVHPDANRSVHSPAPPSERQYAASPTKTASDGRMSPMPASQARDATQSPGPSATPGPKESEAPKSPLASSGASASGSEQPPQAESQTPGEPSKSPASDDAPISPVKRQPTPHTTALLSSMAATSESQPPVPDLPPQSQTPTQPTAQAPQTTTQDSPASHVRHDSPISQTTQRQTPQVPVGPSREGTPVAQPQQQQPPPPPQQAASPVRPYGNQPPPQQGPVALNGPPGGRYPQQPLGAPGHQNQQMYKQPPGPPPQRRAPNGQFPQQQPSGPPMQQGFSQQAAPAQGQPPATQPEGQEPKWKGWKNRVSNQMAQMTAPSGQGKQEGEAKPQKESWKNRFSSQLAQAPPQGNEVKTEKPTKEGKPGWKDKVTGQLSQIAPQSGQDKHEKSDKTSTGDKLFGAFKKGPKPGESTAPAPPPKTSPQRPPVQPEQQQWRPSPAQQGRGMPPQQWAGHPAYGQYAYQGQVRPGPPTMLPGQYQQYQQQPPHPQQQQYQQAQWAAAGQPPPAQQQWPAYGQQQVRRPPEPQYDSVPIPKGYNAVHGEGSTAPTNYNVGRQVSPQGQYFGGQQSYAQQQGDFPQGQAPAGQSPVMSPPVAAGASQQVQQIQQTAPVRSGSATPGEHGGFNLPIQGNVTPGDEPQTSPLRGGRPPNVRHASVVSDAGYSIESGALGGTGQRVLPPGQPQQGHHLQTQSSTASLNAQAPSRGSSQVSSSTEVAQPKQSVPRRPVSLSPDAALEGKYESNAKNLTVDVEKSKQDTDDIYDVTPRLHQDRTGVSDVSKSNSNGSAEAPKSPVKDKQDEDAAHIELEDTADARMRTMRLNSQEEKIFYDPEGDIPKMSATSYPGQEWNPYGEPEFADFRDD